MLACLAAETEGRNKVAVCFDVTVDVIRAKSRLCFGVSIHLDHPVDGQRDEPPLHQCKNPVERGH